MKALPLATVARVGLALALGFVAAPLAAQLSPAGDAGARSEDPRLGAPEAGSPVRAAEDAGSRPETAPDASLPGEPAPSPSLISDDGAGDAGRLGSRDAGDAGAPRPSAPDASAPDSTLTDAGFGGAAPGDAATTDDAAADAATDTDTSDAEPPDASLDDDAGASSEELDGGAVPSVIPEPDPPDAGEMVTEPTRPAPIPSAARPGLALKTILAMVALLVLAYAANHPRVRSLEELLGIRSVITTGFPFVALGLIARHPSIGVLSEDVLIALTPVIEFGLGWLGFLVGFRLDLRRLDALPNGAARVVGITTVSASVAIAVACALAMALLGFSERGVFLRTGLVLAAAGAMTAPAAIRALIGKRGSAPVAQYLDEVIGVAGLWLIAAYFRPDDLEAQWALPGTAWLVMALGLGVMLGTLLHVILRRPGGDAEFMVIALGGVAFTAGLAAYVRLSPLVIAFIAGAVVTNLPTPRKEALGHTLARVERPIFLVLLTLAGALWDPADLRGWALMLVFLGSRYAGLWIGRRIAQKAHPETFADIRPESTLIAPLSVVAIAVVVNVRILYGGTTVPLVVTAVIGGALLAEMIAAFADKRAREESAP